VLKKDMTIITLREEVPFVDFVTSFSPHEVNFKMLLSHINIQI